MRALSMVLMFGLASAAAVDALAQDAPPPATPPAPTCTDPAYRDFDFWLGEWIVHGGPGGDQLQGRNRILRSDNGCWLSEHWTSATGRKGTSLNAWDAGHGVWRQFWVGADGVVLRLQGGRRDGAMVMEGVLPRAGGGAQQQRITWTPADDGSVSQRWETSDDAGDSWQVAFLGVYRRAQEDAVPDARP